MNLKKDISKQTIMQIKIKIHNKKVINMFNLIYLKVKLKKNSPMQTIYFPEKIS